MFRKFVWKNLIFEPKLTAIHFQVIQVPEHKMIFRNIVKDVDFSANFNFIFILIFGNFFCYSHVPALFLALQRWGISILALLET